MSTSSVRKFAASTRPSLMLGTTRQGKGRKAKPSVFSRLVQSFHVDGRDLQSVTEFWSGKPKGIKAYADPTRPGVFVTTRLYCPLTKVFFAPDASLNPNLKAIG